MKSIWATKKYLGEAQQMHLVVKELRKQWKESSAAPFHYLSPRPFAAWSMLTHWIRHFPPMDLMDPNALAGNGSNAIWRDWRDPLTDHQVAALRTLFIRTHSSGEPARTFDARKQFNLTDWPFLDPQEKLSLVLDLSECCCNIFLTFPACDEEKACKTPVEIIFADKFSQVAEIKFADKFSQVFPARVFAGNLGVKPSERFHICSNIGNPPASLLFSNGFHISGVSHWKFKKSFLDKIWYCEFVMAASKERWLPPSSQPKLDYIWIP